MAAGSSISGSRCSSRLSPAAGRRTPRSGRPPGPRAAAGPRCRWRARPRSRRGARPSPTARTRRRGGPPAPGWSPARRENRRSPSLAIDDRRGAVRAVDRDLLGDVVGVRSLQAGRAHEDQRLGREVDVLLVLGGVEGDRLVAELRRLHPHFLRGDAVAAVADHRPVAPRHRVSLRDLGDRGAALEHLQHRVGERAQRLEHLVDTRRIGRGHLVGDGDGEEAPGGDLRVERLGGRHRHLDVAAVGRVEHAVGLVDEVAVAPVDDGDDRGTPRTRRGRRCGWCRWSCRSG